MTCNYFDLQYLWFIVLYGLHYERQDLYMWIYLQVGMRPSSTMHNPLRCNYRWEACQVTRLQHVLITDVLRADSINVTQQSK